MEGSLPCLCCWVSPWLLSIYTGGLYHSPIEHLQQLGQAQAIDVRRSAHLGNPYLTLGNENVRSRTSAALAAVREAADHRLLDARTQGTRARAPVKVRPQKSHGEKLERCAKLRKVSDLMHAEDGVGRDGAVTAFWSST